MNHPTLTFAQLHPGDRFTLPADHRLFTKLTDSTAREHSVHSINLKEEGYGYAEDPIKNLPGGSAGRVRPGRWAVAGWGIGLLPTL